MDVLRPVSSGQSAPLVPGTDPRLRPTPDYGTLGPGSDTAPGANASWPVQRRTNGASRAPLFAFLIGVSLALLVATARTPLSRFAELFSQRKSSPVSAQNSPQLDRLKPQQQAETLLEHPDLHWRPLAGNPNFLGVYRLEILR